MARHPIDTTTNNGGFIGDPLPTAFGKVNTDLAALMDAQNAGYVWIAPAAAAGVPVFRRLVAADIPSAFAVTLSTTANIGFSVASASFAAIAIRATGPNGREYRLVSTDDTNGLGGSKLVIYNQTNAVTAASFDINHNFLPGADNARSCGASGARWSVVWAATGAISTSDGREKDADQETWAVRPLNAAELTAAKALAREVGAYRWLSAIAVKGDAARVHIGMTVQRAIAIMVASGLDPMRYGFICYDSWPAQPEVLAEENDGMAREAIAAGDLYSFRMDELYAFIVRGLVEQIEGHEARLAQLEESAG